MTDEIHYVRTDVMGTIVDDDLLIFDETAGTYFTTSGVGKVIWEALERPVTLEALCDVLMQKYEVDRQTCVGETTAFLEHLEARNLLMPQK